MLSAYRIVRVVTWLRHENSVRTVAAFDKVVSTDIRHDFRAWEYLRVELQLDLMPFLRSVSGRVQVD